MVNIGIGDFLLEIGTEELAPKQIPHISNHIKDGIVEALKLFEIEVKNLKSHYSPRRLFWFFEALPLEARQIEVDIKGPPEKLCKNENNELSQTALAFIKKNNLDPNLCYFKDAYLFGKQVKHSPNLKKYLEEILPKILHQVAGTRFMRWGSGTLKFSRPIQWIAALIDKGDELDVLNFELEGIVSDVFSRGHRFLAPGKFAIKSYQAYIQELEKNFVILDQNQRQSQILEQATFLAQSLKASLVINDELLKELANITEYPSAILCQFDPKFLKIPDCVLKTVMINHQRYLPLEKNSKLIPQFIVIANNPLEKAKANIQAGNEKVIIPRFKDAEFFVEEDLKINLEERLPMLKKLNFLKGDFYQKSLRIQKISKYLAEELKVNNLEDILRASLLAKTDLTTNLVFEFTELQGEIAAVYAQMQGLSPIVCAAISEHYRPRFAGDNEPESIEAKIISIADKIDNIILAFALGKIPSGSADPFALRRQANGMLEIIVNNQLNINVEKLMNFVIDLQKNDFGDGLMITKIKGRNEERKEVQVPELNWQECFVLVRDFFESRLEFVFEIYHKDTKLNKAILALGSPLQELRRRHNLIHAFGQINRGDKFATLIEAANRIIKIADTDKESRAELDDIDINLFALEQEANLFEVIKTLDSSIDKLEEKPEIIFEINSVINDFFDKVLVNAEQEDIKKNRKNLIKYASKVFAKICDFALLRVYL